MRPAIRARRSFNPISVFMRNVGSEETYEVFTSGGPAVLLATPSVCLIPGVDGLHDLLTERRFLPLNHSFCDRGRVANGAFTEGIGQR